LKIFLNKGVLSKNFSNKSGIGYFVLVLAIVGPGVMLLIKIIVTILKILKEKSSTRIGRNSI
jgi:hypothetical protein